MRPGRRREDGAMRVICARDRLGEAMAMAGGIVNQRSTNPITGNVLLTAGKGSLEVRATDLEVSLVHEITEVEVKAQGKCLVEASLLAGLVKDASGETVEIEAKDKTVEIKAGRDRFELNSADPDDFPKLPDPGTGTKIKLKGADLSEAIRRVGRNVALEKGRYALNGVLLEPAKSKLEFCGTDGRRLAYFSTAAKGKEADRQVIVPSRGYNLISRVVGSGDGDVEIMVGETRLDAVFGGTRVGTQLVEGQFPDYRGVIPKNLDKSFAIPVDEFKSALVRAKYLTSVETQAVKLEIRKGELTIRAKSHGHGQAEVKAEIEYDGDDLDIGFDPQYILQGLDSFGEEKVIFEFKDAETGAIMHEGDRERFFFLVMPIDL